MPMLPDAGAAAASCRFAMICRLFLMPLRFIFRHAMRFDISSFRSLSMPLLIFAAAAAAAAFC